jgi:diacylglycerol kinase
MKGRYNFDENEADVLFATNEKEEAIQAAKDFGQGTVVISVLSLRKYQIRTNTTTQEK